MPFVCVWIMFFACLGVGLYIAIKFKWSIFDSIIFCGILELPTYIIFPIVCQTIKFDNDKISLCCWFIKIRTFSWMEVSEIGSAYSRGRSARVDFIYISKRPITNKERFNINGVKDKKNFITLENRGNIIEDIEKYSKLPFRDLPTTDDFYNT